MKVHVGAAATAAEAEAIARSLAEHLGVGVDIHVGNDDDPTASADPPEIEYPLDDDLGPTDRERDLRAEIDDILQGGPEKYRDRLPEQGKLFVRDRLDLWFGGEGGTRGTSDASAGGAGDASADGAGDTSADEGSTAGSDPAGSDPAGIHFEDGKFAAFDDWHPDSPTATSTTRATGSRATGC